MSIGLRMKYRYSCQIFMKI